MADAKPPAKILRVLGNPDSVLERTHVGIYDYLDSLTTLAFTHSVALQPPFPGAEAYTTIETVGFPFTKRRLMNFSGPFLITDDAVNQRTNIDIGLFSTSIKGAVSASGGGSTNFLRADGVWAAPPGGGITQLTGDVIAGPGSGSVAATLASIPDNTPAAGAVRFTNRATPTTVGGKISVWADGGNSILQTKDNFGFVSSTVWPLPATPSRWVNSLVSGILVTSQPAFTDISGSLAAGQFGPLTGDVTTSGYVATLANIPSATPAAGSLLFSIIAAPSAPAAGKASVYVDSTSRNLAVISSTGAINHGIRTRTTTASQWINAIADDGTTTISQPAFTDISGSITLSQLGSGGALSVLGVSANSSGTRADIATTAGTGFTLRENGAGALGFGTLTTGAYGANTVTYAKIQTTGAGSVLLGRGNSGAGAVQELTVTGVGTIGASALNVPKQCSLTWGGGSSIGSFLAVPLTIALGVGDNAFFDSSRTGYSSMGFVIPFASSAQDWSVNVYATSLTGGGFYNVTFLVNNVSIATLANISATLAPTHTTTSTSQPVNAGDIMAVHISVASGTIGGSDLAIYVVGAFH